MGPAREPSRVKIAGEGKVRIGGHAQRTDGTRYTKSSLDARRAKRRADNARARAARRAKRAR